MVPINQNMRGSYILIALGLRVLRTNTFLSEEIKFVCFPCLKIYKSTSEKRRSKRCANWFSLGELPLQKEGLGFLAVRLWQYCLISH